MRKKSYDYLSLLIIIWLYSFIIPVIALNENKSLTPIADSFIDFYEPTLNFGDDHYLRLGYYSDFFRGYLENSSPAQFETFIKFDLSQAPSIFYKIELRLELTYIKAPTQVEFYETFSYWNEDTITWNNAPSYRILLTSILISQAGFLTVDLTDFLEDETGDWSICLATNDLNPVAIASRQCYTHEESGLNFDPPKLIYHYKVSDLPIIIGVTVAIGAVSIIGGLIYAKYRRNRKVILEEPYNN